MPGLRTIALVALCLALFVVPLGAFVRLSDAGLGCPDWPGCYGKLVGVPEQPVAVEQALQAFPGKPVEPAKAWKEMIHRYAAGTLGLLVFAASGLAWRRNKAIAASLAAMIVFQALLGMWTVTLLLKPAIVTGHLLGGMTIIALLALLADAPLRLRALDAEPPSRAVRLLAGAALAVTALQIALGGWLTSNYAAFVCPDFPTCRGSWLPETDFGSGFTLVRHLGQTAEGAPLSIAAMTAIHIAHRAGALAAFLGVGALALALRRLPGWRNWSIALAVALGGQLALGIGNILLGLPLALAVAHNFGAAMLLLAVVSLNRSFAEMGRRSVHDA